MIRMKFKYILSLKKEKALELETLSQFQCEITAMYRDRKKWEKGKCLFSEIKDGEWAVCIIHNIHSGMIHTISSPYNEDLLKDGWICFRRDGGIVQ